MGCGTDGQTDGRTEWNQYTPPTTSLCVGYNKWKHKFSFRDANLSSSGVQVIPKKPSCYLNQCKPDVNKTLRAHFNTNLSRLPSLLSRERLFENFISNWWPCLPCGKWFTPWIMFLDGTNNPGAHGIIGWLPYGHPLPQNENKYCNT